MGRPRLGNPRRERLTFYLTKIEAEMLDGVLEFRFKLLETESDRLRAMALEWSRRELDGAQEGDVIRRPKSARPERVVP